MQTRKLHSENDKSNSLIVGVGRAIAMISENWFKEWIFPELKGRHRLIGGAFALCYSKYFRWFVLYY